MSKFHSIQIGGITKKFKWKQGDKVGPFIVLGLPFVLKRSSNRQATFAVLQCSCGKVCCKDINKANSYYKSNKIDYCICSGIESRLIYKDSKIAIILSNSHQVIIDRDIFDTIKNFNIATIQPVSKDGIKGQIIVQIKGPNDKKFTKLARFIMGIQNTLQVDHIDNDTLNNLRSNLRITTQTQNSYNTKKKSGSRWSVYKGVHFSCRSNKWVMSIQLENKRLRKEFKTEKEAACAYDIYAREHFGEYGRYNFPLDGENSAIRSTDEPI